MKRNDKQQKVVRWLCLCDMDMVDVSGQYWYRGCCSYQAGIALYMGKE